MSTTPNSASPPSVSVARLCGTGGLAATHAALYLTQPLFGVAFTSLEAAVVVIVLLTALFAPDKFSDRAFRLLSWIHRQ